MTQQRTVNASEVTKRLVAEITTIIIINLITAAMALTMRTTCISEGVGTAAGIAVVGRGDGTPIMMMKMKSNRSVTAIDAIVTTIMTAATMMLPLMMMQMQVDMAVGAAAVAATVTAGIAGVKMVLVFTMAIAMAMMAMMMLALAGGGGRSIAMQTQALMPMHTPTAESPVAIVHRTVPVTPIQGQARRMPVVTTASTFTLTRLRPL